MSVSVFVCLSANQALQSLWQSVCVYVHESGFAVVMSVSMYAYVCESGFIVAMSVRVCTCMSAIQAYLVTLNIQRRKNTFFVDCWWKVNK